MGVREISREGTRVAFPAIAELRTHITALEEFVRLVDEDQRPEGYRLVGAFEDGDEDAVAVAGFRTGTGLSWGRYLYVDDFVTRETHRRQGHAGALMDWLADEARRLGCSQLHLDSGSQRYDAHRLYLQHGFVIPGFHFARRLDPPD